MLAAGLLAAAAGAQAPAPTTITVAVGTDLRSTDPGVNRDDTTDAVIGHVVETLVTFRSDLTIAPMLAESIAVSDDRRSYTFKLRKGLRFHDGTAVTADVVRWNWQRFLDPEHGWSCKGLFDGSARSSAAGVHVEKVEAPSPDTVVFRLAKPSPLFLTLLASIQCLPGVYARSSVNARGEWDKPVGTGPFIFEEWRRGRDITLRRNAQYASRGEKPDGLAGSRVPRVERVRFMIVPDATASIQAFNAGQLDVLPNLAPSVVADVRKRAGVALERQQMLGWTALLLQTRDPLLKDVRMRKAIAHAIDRPQIARIATGGTGKPNPSAIQVSSAWRTEAHDRYPGYDPAAARKLLKEAGYRGQPVVIQTNRHYPNLYDNSVMAQALLQQAGINARIEVLDWATQLSNYQAGKFQITSFSYSARFDPALVYGLLLGNKDERATAQWENSAAAAILATASTSDDAAARKRAFEQLHAAMARDVPIIGLYNAVSITATAPEIKGYRTWPGATPILWEVTKRREGAKS